MRESIVLFGQMCEHTYLEKTNMILFLNKKDLFATKLKTKPLSICFPGLTFFILMETVGVHVLQFYNGSRVV